MNKKIYYCKCKICGEEFKGTETEIDYTQQEHIDNHFHDLWIMREIK